MRIDNQMNEKAILKEIAVRFKQTRIDSSITRKELADISMVSVATIARFESGGDIGFVNLIKLLSAMNMESSLDELIPDPFNRPSYHLESTVIRKRARKQKPSRDWKWGDEE